MSEEISERGNRLRKRLRADSERRQSLPEAICSLCGGVVPAGSGTLFEVSPWASSAARREWAETDQYRESRGDLPVMGWRRRHASCVNAVSLVQQLTGMAVPATTATSALARLPRTRYIAKEYAMALAPDSRVFQGRPRAWSHVNAEERQALAKAVKKVRDETEPRRCSDGPCAWCGVQKSVGWEKGPETWRDGSAAPLCSTCADVWEHLHYPDDLEERRAAALFVLSGARGFEPSSLGLAVYSDVADDERAGTPEPWTFAPEPLTRIREQARLTWHGSLVDPAMREEYQARAIRDSNAAYAALRAEMQEAEQRAKRERLAAGGWVPPAG